MITLKIKLQEIYEKYLKDYILDIKKYYIKSKKYLKKIYRKLRYHWQNPQTKLGQKLKSIYETKPAKVSLTIIGIIITIGIISSLIKPSYAIYQNEHQFSIISGIVGIDEYDYTLLIYVENPTSKSNNSKYSLSDNIPLFGYTYSGYNCKNDSTLTFSEETKNTKVDLVKKDVCSIYFDLTSSSDITINIMLEDTVDSATYSISKNIPYYGYKYSYYECDNNSDLTYNSTQHKVNFKSSNKDVCKIYFQKESSDIEVSLYVEDSYGSNNYIKKNEIPSGQTYTLNAEESECLNNNERTETEISYSNGYIEIDSDEVTYCKVYLNIANE